MEIDEEAAPHGQKRPPEDELENEQRLTKRFNLLNLAQAGQISSLYISKASQPTSPTQRKRSNAFSSEDMNVDETRDRVYIHDLDEEIADIESEEEKLVFIPDIEKKLNKIPTSVLTGNRTNNESNEVVLYGIPESLSIPQEQDVVRKAIMETRNRLRESQEQPKSIPLRREGGTLVTGFRSQYHAPEFPPTYAQMGPGSQSSTMDSQDDAMDIG